MALTNTEKKTQIEKKRFLKLYIKKKKQQQSLPLATVWHNSENMKPFHTGPFPQAVCTKIFIN